MKKDNIKALTELRAEKVQELEKLYATLEAEQRAMTEEEEKALADVQAEIENIDKTIKVLADIKEKLIKANEGVDSEDATEERAEDERKSFENYLRGAVMGEVRADSNMTLTDNGAVVPQSISDHIVKRIYEISPILEKATKYNIKGNLTIPYYPADSTDVQMAYATEFTDLTASTGKFGSITLSGFLAGALVKISRSLINNSHFDIVSFVTEHMAYEAARWIEGQLLNGTSDKVAGLSTTTQGVKAASQTAITADELIQLQDSVKDAFQNESIWIMSAATRTAIRLLKDGEGRYLLNNDATTPFGYSLLGKPVYVSDNMPSMAAGKKVIFYGDMSGLAVKLSEEFEIQVLREHYAAQHAVGVVGWVELDSKIENEQKIAALTMAG